METLQITLRIAKQLDSDENTSTSSSYNLEMTSKIGRNLRGINILHNYARRLHCGLILNGGFVEHEVPNLQTQTVISYDALGELNAGNFLARRSLEDICKRQKDNFGEIE